MFYSDFPPQFISTKFSSLNLENNTFEQTDQFDAIESSYLRMGSAILADSTVRLQVNNNKFRSMINDGGVISITENAAGVSVEDLYPNEVETGEKIVYFSNNLFDQCKSYGDEGGGSLFYGCSLEGCQLYLANNTFQNGYSSTKGGAASWTYMRPSGLQASTFINNSAAMYGSNIGAVPQRLQTVSKAFYEANIASEGDIDKDIDDPYPDLIIQNQSSGEDLPDIYIGIFDTYNRLVKTSSGDTLSSSITGNASDTYEAFITESISIISVNGLFKVEGISITATPGTSQTVTFTTSSIDEEIPSNKEYLLEHNKTNSGIVFSVEVSFCQSGEEFLSNGQCRECAAEKEYLIEPPTTVTSCIPCPLTYAQCLGGSAIVPRAGFWKTKVDTDNILECFTSSACEGYTEENHNYQGGCSSGYQGVLCGDCEPGYSRNGDFECAKCPKEIYNILRISGFLLLMVIILFVLVKFTIQGANNKRNILAVYNRVLVNHVQMVVIIYSFRLRWPDSFDEFYKSNEQTGEIAQQFISFDCFFDKRTDEDLDANTLPLFYYRLIIGSALPFLIFLVTYATWSFVFLYYQCKDSPEKRINRRKYMEKLSEQKSIRVSATNMIILIFIHPSILEIYFEMFNCIDIDDTLRLARDLDVKCYEGKHTIFTFCFALPSIIIWGFGIPAYALIKLISKHKQLAKVEVREELGYLYNGYAEHGYYWEPIIMFRKVIMVFLSTLQSLAGKRIQAMLGFVVMVSCIILHNNILPFMSQRLNILESMSIVALMISMYSGVFFVTDKNSNMTAKESGNEFTLSDSEKTILFLLFIGSNVVFLFYWFILFVVEANRYSRIKFQKVYHYLCLCGNKNAIEREQEKRKAFIRADEMIDNFMDFKQLIKRAREVVKDGEHPEIIDYLLHMSQQLAESKKRNQYLNS